MVASVTDSPSVGTRISVMVCFLNNLRGHAISSHRPPSRRAMAGDDNRFLGHDPEKCEAVFRKGHAQTKS
jgi:hypothetical protein